MRITFSDTILAAGLAAAEPAVDLRIEARRESQTTERFRAETARIIDRGNVRHRVRFEVSRRHASAEAAARHALGHAASLGGVGAVAVFTAEDGPRQARFFLHDAVVVEAEVRPAGQLTFHRYELLGGALTRQPPAALTA
jgi:hypothetical protein